MAMSRINRILTTLLIFGIIAGFSPWLWFGIYLIGVNTSQESSALSLRSSESNLVTVQNNSLVAPVNLPSPEIVVKKMKVIATAYSSSPEETDETPFVTANGTQVKEGIIANNLLPFGTKIRIPEIYGDKVFIVEDRMNWRKGYYHVDIWFPSKEEAKIFGAQKTLIEVLEG